MKKLLLLLTMVMPLVGYAADSYEIEQLETKCQHEQSSLMKNRYGTPSCDQLDRIMHHNRTPAVVQSTVIAPKNDNSVATYNWSGAHNRYCYFNNKGEIISCP